MVAPLGTLNSIRSLLEASYTGMNHQLIRCEVLRAKRDLGKGSMPRSHRRVAFSKRPACRGWRFSADGTRFKAGKHLPGQGGFASPLAAANDVTDINQQMLTGS